MSPRIKPKTFDHDLAEKNLRLLAADETALNGLIEYVACLVEDAEDTFTDMAQTAVFDDTMRLSAVHSKGILDGLSDFHRRLVTLQTTGR